MVRVGDAFLARLRPEGAPYSGYWEFPGGKCEPGESPEEATCRECLEESGMTVKIVAARRVITHDYPHARVELHAFDCLPLEIQAGPSATSGFVWVPALELPRLRFPEANARLLEELAREARARNFG